MRSPIAARIMAKTPTPQPIKLDRPFWYDMLNWRQLHWLQMFYEARHYPQNTWEIDTPDGKLIFYKCGAVRFVNKTFNQ